MQPAPQAGLQVDEGHLGQYRCDLEAGARLSGETSGWWAAKAERRRFALSL